MNLSGAAVPALSGLSGNDKHWGQAPASHRQAGSCSARPNLITAAENNSRALSLTGWTPGKKKKIRAGDNAFCFNYLPFFPHSNYRESRNTRGPRYSR